MLKNLIVLPNGTEIFSGGEADNAIEITSIKECVNNETELTLGSVCASMLDIKIKSPEGNLSIVAGDETTLYKVSDSGRTKLGLFTADKPTRSSANSYKLTAYDRITWLDKDLTSWLASLDGWPYTLGTFAQMVCTECGLTLATTSFPNDDFPVNKFLASKATGRQLMSWIGQLAARFVRATPDGEIEFAWYTSSGVTIRPSGDRYYFTSSLKYEDYQVAKIDAVQLRLADSEYGMLWPEASSGANTYVISGNYLITEVTEDILPYLQVILDEIANVTYTPCTVSIPACLDIRAGQTVDIVDRNGVTFTTYVMTKTQKGQKDTLECTGSYRRDSSGALYGSSTPASKEYADNAANAAVKRQTQLDIFNTLTNNGQVQGLFIDENGQVWINASYISTGILASKDGETFYLDLDEGILDLKARSLTIQGQSVNELVLEGLTQEDIIRILTEDGTAQGIFLQDGQLYINANYITSGALNASLITAGVLKSRDGETFVLDLENGTLKMKGVGQIMSPDGNSYITLEGNEFVMYARQGTSGSFIDIARIGFTEDSEGYDYPYFLMGHADADGENFDKIGLMKMFKNGIYLGNSAPRNSTGSFVGLPGAVGFFVNTLQGIAYSVDGETLTDVSEARFA